MTDGNFAMMRGLSSAEIDTVAGGVMAPLDPETGRPDPDKDCTPPFVADLPGAGRSKLSTIS